MKLLLAQHLAQRSPYIVDGKRIAGPGALTWAFATGECGDGKWGNACSTLPVKAGEYHRILSGVLR